MRNVLPKRKTFLRADVVNNVKRELEAYGDNRLVTPEPIAGKAVRSAPISSCILACG